MIGHLKKATESFDGKDRCPPRNQLVNSLDRIYNRGTLLQSENQLIPDKPADLTLTDSDPNLDAYPDPRRPLLFWPIHHLKPYPDEEKTTE